MQVRILWDFYFEVFDAGISWLKVAILA